MRKSIRSWLMIAAITMSLFSIYLMVAQRQYPPPLENQEQRKDTKSNSDLTHHSDLNPQLFDANKLLIRGNLGSLRKRIKQASEATRRKKIKAVNTQCRPASRISSFREAVKTRAIDGVIILSLVDEAFVDMAMNFYLTSLKPHFICNFLFVGVGHRTCKMLHNNISDMACVHYTSDPSTGKASRYGSRDFKRKMNIRTSMVLDALKYGYTVVHSDLDIVFMKNPLKTLKTIVADVAVLWDFSNYNAGFVFVRSYPHGVQIYEYMKKLTQQNSTIDDQYALNIALEAYKNTPGFKVTKLDENQFQCGRKYFSHRLFPSQLCHECIVVHNNWILTKEAKIYRFKEHHMWSLDTDGYYSSADNKYLTYANYPLHNSVQSKHQELDALKSALAISQILNRILILPRFHCHPKKQEREFPLTYLLSLSRFDRQFKEKYRESTFLSNRKTPRLSHNENLLVISTPTAENIIEQNKLKLIGVKRYASQDRVNSQNILKWFGHRKERVLRFHSMYGLKVMFSDSILNTKFYRQLSKSFHLISHTGRY